MHRTFLLLASVVFFSVCLSGQNSTADTGNRITILYDAFTSKPELTADWGYAALVEFEGTRILFDTGNNAAIFEANIKRLRIDLTRLDLVVLSHRHGDHTSGLRYVLSVNPWVPIYAPADESFLDVTPAAFLTQSADASLPSKMRYFGGKVPSTPPSHGTAWPGVHFRTVVGMQEITPKIRLVSTLSETPGFRDLSEVSLVLDTARGPIVVVGCSHPGIENILSNVTQQIHRSEVYEVIGGMHLLLSSPARVEHIVSELVDRYHVQRVAPGHCTGELVFAVLEKRFGKEYVYAGVAEVLQL
ncbi:MAG: MBL fold metallo-hydrolase [Acidobacteriia bacterium]|nr:MBL fold metallo-hydrolase [Terriglobia bacterium]